MPRPSLLTLVWSLDWVLIGTALLLTALGLAMIFSATYVEQPFSSLFIRQAIVALVGFTVFLSVARQPYHSWQRYSLVFYFAGVAGLALVAVLAPVIRGTVSRFAIGGIQVQPSEFAKVTTIIGLAWLLARYRTPNWRLLVVSGLLAAVPVALIAFEPDLGGAGLLLFLWASLLLFLGLPWRTALLVAMVALVGALASWQWFLLDYQRARLATFIYPDRDPLGAGYNVVQSIVALGSGQMFGRGLGHGPQSQLKFLPERHTDFILSSIGEELGLIGVVIVLGLYVVLLRRVLAVARLTRDQFGQLLSVSTFLLLLTSLFVSAGMNMGLLPVTGIPLPFVSFGGSNLVATFLLLGLVESVRLHSTWVQAPPAEMSSIT